MQATGFENRHQTLLHLLVVGLAFLMYAVERDDVVWALIKHHTTYRALLERVVFGVGALMIMGSATLQTWARASVSFTKDLTVAGPYRYVRYPLYVGRVLFALGIGLLAPAWGTAILLFGEMLLVARLLGHDRAAGFSRKPQELDPARQAAADWAGALRKEVSKWGLAVTMIAFTLTLRDRVAELLAGASFLLWLALNVRDFVPFREDNHA